MVVPGRGNDVQGPAVRAAIAWAEVPAPAGDGRRGGRQPRRHGGHREGGGHHRDGARLHFLCLRTIPLGRLRVGGVVSCLGKAADSTGTGLSVDVLQFNPFAAPGWASLGLP